MPKYQFACPDGHAFTLHRSFADMALAAHCPTCGRAATRDLAAEFRSQYIPPRLDRKQWTMWGDLFDRSPREMARDKTVERYDPTMPHKRPYSPPSGEQLLRLTEHLSDREIEAAASREVTPPPQWKE